MKQLYFLSVCLFFSYSLKAQISIADARNQALGSTVTVRGIVTNGDELGPIRYFQDGTAGIAAYDGNSPTMNFVNQVQRGDSIEVRGVLKSFRELLELDPILDFQVISRNNDMPEPKLITPDQLGVDNESQLVRLECINFSKDGNFGVGTHLFQSNTGAESVLYIRSGHPLENSIKPSGPVELVGISSRFEQPQLLLRNSQDLVEKPCFFISEGPFLSDQKTNGFQLSWTTNEPGSSLVRYGLTPALGQEQELTSKVIEHQIQLDGLQDAQFYYVQVVSEQDGFEISSPIKLYSTASFSSGEIQVHFNQSVDRSYSTGSVPISTSPNQIEQAIVERINAAKQTVDFCAYNINRTAIVTALKAAHSRGVRVRYIGNQGTSNTGLIPQPAFPVILVNNNAFMHNKFVVVDAADTDQCWVLTGSLNFTASNVLDDYNNMVFIQDQALAKAYTWEFEEMWGSDDLQSNSANRRIGSLKQNNTPHEFMIGGKLVESYFSPSDRTTDAIVEAIGTADRDLQFAVLAFTKNEIGDAVVAAKDRGVLTRGIINDFENQGSEYPFLQNAGIQVEAHRPARSLHHKYAIIDADDPNSDPMVITGSHNWSNKAENENDENTLIIHDATVANLFLQEFEARWAELGATSVTVVSLLEGVELNLFPVPADDQIHLSISASKDRSFSLKLWDLQGRLLRQESKISPSFNQWNVSQLPNGIYLLGLQSGSEMMVRKIEVAH